MRTRRAFVAALLGIWLILLGPGAQAEQEPATAPVTVDVAAPTPVTTATLPAQSTVVTPTPTPTPTPVDTATSTPEVPQTPTAEATATAAMEPTVTPTPAAQLSTAINPMVQCELNSNSGEVLQGGSIDYRCSVSVDLAGSDTNGETVQLDWSLSATTAAGWSVQLKLPEQSWGSAGQSVSLAHQHTVDVGETTSVMLVSDVRISRQACVIEAATIALTSSVAVQLLDANGLAAGAPVRGMSTGAIAPVLAAIPAPDLSFAGALDFGEVSPAAWGDAVSTSGEITLVVSGLAASCGTWNVVLSGSILQASNGSTIPVGNLELSAVNDRPVSSGSCSLASGCLVVQLVTSPRAVDTEFFRLRLTLTVPPETLSASFSSSITAEIEAA